MTRLSAKWCGILAAFLLAVPLLSATAVGEGVGRDDGQGSVVSKRATVIYAGTTPTRGALAVQATPLATPLPRLPTPTLMPPPTTPLPTMPPTPVPTPPTGICDDVRSVNVIDAELAGVVQAGIDLISAHFGCQKFRIDGAGLPVKFGEITAMLNAKVLGFAYSTPDVYEIWLNRDCWGVVQQWDGVIAHELGHYLGWQHGDDHPYMWLAPPPGSYAQPGDAAIVCY